MCVRGIPRTTSGGKTRGVRGAGLARLAVAGVAISTVAGGQVPPTGWAAYAGITVAALTGFLLLARRPRFFLQLRLTHALLDGLAIGLVVAWTGGLGSAFAPLYFPATLGLARLAPGRSVVAASALVGSYLFAAGTVTGFSLQVASGAAAVALSCAVAGYLGAGLRRSDKAIGGLDSDLTASEDFAGRTAALVAEFDPVLANMDAGGLLAWGAATTRRLTGAPYVHVATQEGAHRTVAGDEAREAYPTCWHPEVGRLVLWSCRSKETSRADGVVGLEGLVAVPLVPPDGVARGAVIVGRGLSSEDEHLVGLVASRIAAALQASAEAAPGGRDPVTGLPNDASLRRVLRRDAERGARPAVVVANLDGFGHYNDLYGVDAGDAMLRRVGQTLQAAGLAAFRLGGGEFAVLLRAPNRNRARGVALKVRRLVADLPRRSLAPLDARVGYSLPETLGNDLCAGDGRLEAALAALEAAKALPERIAEAHVAQVATDGRLRAPNPTGATGTAAGSHRRVAETLVEAVRSKDPYTGEHLLAVADLAGRIGFSMGLTPQQLETLFLGALLHDVGKIGVPDDILKKRGPLNLREREVLERHPSEGGRILGPLGGPISAATPAVRHHHERYDGLGYPDGLAGEEIPILSRVILVADAFDAMTRDRPYRRGVDREEALLEIESNAGTQFDPEVVRAFARVMSGVDARPNGASGGY